MANLEETDVPNNPEESKFSYLDDLKFLNKMKLDKERRYEPNIIYNKGEMVCIITNML